MKRSHISVADFLNQQINISGIAQKDIAESLGYDKPNIITMFKQGKTKIPLNKIASLAKILGIDPIHFLRIAMTEYSPETWGVLEGLIGKNLISANEQKILSLTRRAAFGHDVAPKNSDQEQEFLSLVSKWAKEEESIAKPATRSE